MSMPLEGIRVLDWTIWQQGPVATAMLGDLGAEVIKIEEPTGGDVGRGLMGAGSLLWGIREGRNFYFENNNRNKKSIALDLKKEGAREIIYRLVEKSDVFVQNFRQGVSERLGLNYKTLSQRNPRLIYASASGYGPKGPDSAEPSMDYLGQARSGIMNAVGDPDMPPLAIKGAIADQMGAIMLAYGIMAAIVARERLGVGQEVDVSHLGSMTALQGLNVAASLMLGKEIPRRERARVGNPIYNHYRCQDGKWIALSMVQSDRFWPQFCQVLGLEELEKDPDFADMTKRGENCERLVSLLDGLFATRTRDEWMTILKEGGGLQFASVNSVSDLASDPQMLENEYIIDFDHPAFGPIKIPGIPVQLSKTPGSVRIPAPELGQHTEEVLLEIGGYTWEEIAELREQEVI